MQRLLKELRLFLECKIYIIVMVLIAIGAYGFAISHPSIGVDDTVVELYYRDGMDAYTGRWSIFLISKLLHLDISSFLPWIVELASVIILLFSVTLWCVLWKRMLEPAVQLPIWNYLFPAGLLLSCPIISEIFVYYLHTGVCSGYGATALALLCFIESLANKQKQRKNMICSLLGSLFFLAFAIGFYEAFISVFVMGAIMLFILNRILYSKNNDHAVYSTRLADWFWRGIITVASSLILRTVMTFLVNFIYQIDIPENYGMRVRPFFGNIFNEAGSIGMILKKYYVNYYLYAIVYLPITVLVISLLGLGIYSLYCGIKKKDILLPVCFLLLIIFPVVMSICEGWTTKYRSAEYVPVVSAFAVLLLLAELKIHHFDEKKKIVSSLCCLILSILLFNQCVDMNRWFYMDYMKYLNSVSVMEQVAYDLEKSYDISKPIIFRGAYEVPFSLIEDNYFPTSSWQYKVIARLTDPIDEHLKEKYYHGNYMSIAETPTISTLQWGVTAFDGTAQQLFRFWEMHGIDGLICETDLNKIEEAEQIRTEKNMPGFPKDGYILECDDYIIVNLEN